MWEKKESLLASWSLTNWISKSDMNVQLSVHSRKKKTPLVPSKRSGYLRLPPPSHINHSLYISIYTYSSLSSLQVPLCSAEEGEKRRRSGADERRRQNCCLLAEGEEGAEVGWPLCDGGAKRRGTVVSIRRRMQGEDRWFLWRRRGRLTEQTVLCLLMEDMFVVLSPVTANRSPSVLQFDSKCEFCCAHTQAPHAQTCLMWKLTTYSALVRWTEMAKGSKGWKVKATRRRTAWFTGRPSRPAWILNFSRPESRA